MTQPTTTPATPTTPAPTAPRNGFGVTALVLGIVGAVFSWVPVFGGILAVLAVVFGGLGYNRARKGEASNSGMSIAGLVLGVIAFVIQVIVFVAVGSAANQVSKDLNTATPFVPNAVAPAPAAPTGPLTSFGAGTYEVGKDVEPGVYRTAGSGGSVPCYWARLNDTNGEFGSIIANGTPTGPTTVTIKTSDAAFETQGSCNWTKVR